MNRVMVTGAGGMVGSHMVELLYKQGQDVLGTYYKPTTDITELDKSIKMIECDIRYFSLIKFIILLPRAIRQFLGIIHRLQLRRILLEQ